MDQAGNDDHPLVAGDLHVEATYRLTEALVESEARMRRRVELLTEVVFETDAEVQLVFLNNAWTKTLGHAPEACLGRPLVGIAELARRAEALCRQGRVADVRPLLDAADAALDPVVKRLRASRPPAG